MSIEAGTTGRRCVSRRRWLAVLAARLAVPAGLLACVASVSAVGATPALAATPAAWAIDASPQPSNFVPGAAPVGNGVLNGGFAAFPQYMIEASNAGGTATSGAITVTDTLPAGIIPSPSVTANGIDSTNNLGADPACAASGQTVTCTFTDSIEPGGYVETYIPVAVDAGATGTLSNQVSVSGGGAQTASATVLTPISSTPASFGFDPGPSGVSAQVVGADGGIDTQAGSHPYSLSLNFGLTDELNPAGFTLGAGSVFVTGHLRDLGIDLPHGLVINPSATPVRCTENQLESDQHGPHTGCPAASQVGVVSVITQLLGPLVEQSPVYNMVPPAGTPAELGFDALGLGIFVHVIGGIDTGGDYSITSTTNDILARPADPIIGAQIQLWGDPSDPGHESAIGSSVPAESTPFLTMPSACSGPLSLSATADSWENRTDVLSASGQTLDDSGSPIGVTGCGLLQFTPSISIIPDTSVADSPSGLDVDLQVPQNDNVGTLASANLRDVSVQLPAGMTVNPSSANGLSSCTPAEIGIDNGSEPSCPDSSKIGTVEVQTPLLPDQMQGAIYVAQQSHNPFGSLLAIYVTAEADGALIKLAGHVVADPVTGQLTTTFDDNPQLPFSDFKLNFFGGPDAVLATPESCGTVTTQSSLSPWSGTPAVSSSDPFTINSGCVSGFSPSLTAGTQNAQAGAYSPFVVSLSRSDTDQNFSGLSVKLPPGMLAKLSGVQECSDAQLASISTAAGTGASELANPSCPAGSQVGTVTTGAGVGPDPYYIQGNAYLTGPYKGAPYGLAVVVPVVAGPFDLGTVVVRQALDIDPTTAQVTDVSDPFPTILDGIPLDIRRIDVDLNRPEFTVNPTSCDPMSVTGTATSTAGLSTSLSSRFQVGGCQDIGFSPKLKIALSGKGQTRSADHPTLTATLTDRSGQANLRSAKVTLPLSMALDPNNSQHVCSYATATAVHGGPVGCPTKTIVGKATAVTPLLSKPLTGNVYLVQGLRCAQGSISPQGTCAGGKTAIHTLPSLLVPLRGQIALDLRAKSSVNGGGALVTTFSTIPDAPVSKFTLQITGGKKGLLVVTGRGLNICAKKQVGDADFGAQSGKATAGSMTLSTPCGKAGRVKVLSRKLSAGALMLGVRTSERGRVTVAGQGLARFSRVLTAGTHEIRVQIMRRSRSTRGSRAEHAASMRVTVQVAPANASPATETLTVRS